MTLGALNFDLEPELLHFVFEFTARGLSEVPRY
jgi:hypothetical protein